MSDRCVHRRGRGGKRLPGKNRWPTGREAWNGRMAANGTNRVGRDRMGEASGQWRSGRLSDGDTEKVQTRVAGRGPREALWTRTLSHRVFSTVAESLVTGPLGTKGWSSEDRGRIGEFKKRGLRFSFGSCENGPRARRPADVRVP